MIPHGGPAPHSSPKRPQAARARERHTPAQPEERGDPEKRHRWRLRGLARGSTGRTPTPALICYMRLSCPFQSNKISLKC